MIGGIFVDGGLLAMVVVVAVWTILVRDSFAAVIGYACYGLLLAFAWVRLAAIDAALTEAAIGGGLTSVLLIRAVVRLRATEASAQAETPGRLQRILAAVLSVAVAVALGWSSSACPSQRLRWPPGSPSTLPAPASAMR